MIGHNSGAWTMPGEYETYLEHYDAAKAAWFKLYGALDDLALKIGESRTHPHVLVSPSGGTWPTQQQFREMFTDAQSKTIPLQGEYNALPDQWKKRAPLPQDAQQEAARERG